MDHQPVWENLPPENNNTYPKVNSLGDFATYMAYLVETTPEHVVALQVQQTLQYFHRRGLLQSEGSDIRDEDDPPNP